MATKNTKSNGISGKTPADLVKILGEKRETLRAFKFGGASVKSKNVKVGMNTRKDIARILTALNAAAKAKKA